MKHWVKALLISRIKDSATLSSDYAIEVRA